MGRFTHGHRDLFGGRLSPVGLYVGVSLFFAGSAMALLGVLIAMNGESLLADPVQRQRFGFTVAALGVPVAFVGIQSMLASRAVVDWLAGGGIVLCSVGVLLFNLVGPGQWGSAAPGDRSIVVVAIYSAGLVVLMFTTGVGLVMNFVSRMVAFSGEGTQRDIFAHPERDVSMDEVLRDIEREVARQKLTWGGMEDGARLPREFVKLKADFGPGALVSKGGMGTVTMTKASEMEVAFDSLARLRGTNGREVADAGDTAVAIEALVAIQRARQARLEASWGYRAKRALGALFSSGAPRDPDARLSGQPVSRNDADPVRTASRPRVRARWVAASPVDSDAKVEGEGHPSQDPSACARRPKAVKRTRQCVAPGGARAGEK